MVIYHRRNEFKLAPSLPKPQPLPPPSPPSASSTTAVATNSHVLLLLFCGERGSLRPQWNQFEWERVNRVQNIYAYLKSIVNSTDRSFLFFPFFSSLGCGITISQQSRFSLSASSFHNSLRFNSNKMTSFSRFPISVTLNGTRTAHRHHRPHRQFPSTKTKDCEFVRTEIIHGDGDWVMERWGYNIQYQ